METIRVQGLAVSREHARREGAHEAFTIMFVHGAHGGRWQFRHWLSRIAGHGFHAEALDLAGHGASCDLPYHVGRMTLSDYVDNIDAVLSAGNPLRTILVGHSMGGLLCLLAAARQRLAGLVLMASATPHGFRQFRADALRRVCLKIPFGNKPFLLPDRALRTLFLSHMPRAEQNAVLLRLTSESSRAAWSILRGVRLRPDTAPPRTLAIISRKDKLIRPASQRLLARQLGALISELPSGHMPHLEPSSGGALSRIISFAHQIRCAHHPVPSS